MKLRLTLVLLSFLVAGSALASNDRRECKEELRKLNAALSTNYTSQESSWLPRGEGLKGQP